MRRVAPAYTMRAVRAAHMRSPGLQGYGNDNGLLSLTLRRCSGGVSRHRARDGAAGSTPRGPARRCAGVGRSAKLRRIAPKSTVGARIDFADEAQVRSDRGRVSRVTEPR